MATIEDFETALKEVVTAKRLSQSKMTSLTEIAMRCMGNDTQMVSILYRTHKGLSSGGKTWSLYAFDALARAARHQVTKNQINPSQVNGNCATFLRKIEGVLDGLFEDIATAGTSDLKEKAKKILDIWAKSNTFPSAVLSPLYALLKQAENDKEPTMPPDQSANPTHNPYAAMPALPPNQAPNPQPSVTPLIGADIQTALFALLSKAANVAGTNGVVHGQTPPNIGPATAPSAPAAPPPPVLDANQLAFLHQLAQTAKGIAPASAQPQPPGVVQQQPVPPSLVPSNSAVPVVPPSAHSANVGGISHPQVYRDDHYDPPSAHARESEHPQYAHGGRYTPDAAAGQSHDPRAAGGYLRGNDYGTPSHDRDAAVRANLTPAGPKPTYDAPGAGYDRTPDPDSSFGYDRDHDRDFDHARDPSRRDSYRDGPPRGFRGSPGGRGRGRGRWDDRRGPGDYPPHDSRDRGRDRDHRDDYRDRDRDHDFDDDRARDRGHRRRRDSRSWSPQSRRRGRPPYSPSRRRGPRGRDERGDGESGFRERYTYVPGRDGAEPGFDEFGREVRPSSPERERQREQDREPEHPRSDSGSVQAPNVNANSHPSLSQGRNESPFPSGSASASVTVSDGGSVAPEDHLPGQGFPSTNRTHQPPTAQSSYAVAQSEPSTSTMASLSPAPPASSATLPPASSLTSTTTSSSTSAAAVDGLGDSGGEGGGGGGLDMFDRETFDPAQPASWAALGQAWATTHGHAPSQEELVQFVFGSALPAPAPAAPSPAEPHYEDGGGGGGYGRGYGPGRGGRGGPLGFGGRGGDDHGEGYDGLGGRGARGRGFGYGRGGRGGEYGARGRGEFEGYARGDYGPPRGGRGRGRGEHFGSAPGREEYGGGAGPGYAYDDSGYGASGHGRGGFGGRGAYGGRGRGDGGGGYGYGYGEYQDTDAVTLTGSGSGDDGSWQVPSGYEAPTSLPYGSEETEQGGSGGAGENGGGGGAGGSTGKMQKVGDRWVFVRGTN